MTRLRGFRFDLNRAIQAAGVVLRDRGPMDRMRLLKILYLASREALKQTGKPIIGGRASALENGPLHDEVFDQIKGSADDTEWREYFHNAGHTVEMKADPGRLDLSPLEIEILNSKADWAEQFETFELSKYTHEYVAEYQQNEPPPGSSKPILVNDILTALGYTDEEAQEVIAEHQTHAALIASLG
jgi:hypothetical protein